MKPAIWRCGVCETVNDGETRCSACGADVTRRSSAVATVRTKLAPPRPAPPKPTPLVEPVRRAINREPVPEEDWDEYDDGRGFLVPMPGGCLYVRRGTTW